MTRVRGKKPANGRERRDAVLTAPRKKKIPFEFVFDELAELSYWTRPMFGCTAIYVGEKIVLVLRYKPERNDGSNGVWVATTKEHHGSLRRELPSLRSIPARAKQDGRCCRSRRRILRRACA